jgi:tetratricopeptide (TPR) repeat protein
LSPRTLAVLLLALPALADQPKETPVGLVLAANGSKMLRANTETPLAAKSGDLLFVGDGLRTESSPVSFVFCPAKVIETLSASGEVRLDARQPKVKAGNISEQPAAACALPQTLRITAATQQHYGITMTRGTLGQAALPVAPNQLPPHVKTELAALDPAFAADPKDPAALVAAAGIYEKHNISANALDAYNKLREQWPEAVWVKSKIFDLEQTLAAQAAVNPPAGGKTYALLVGISKYKKPELSLQFADADATVFSKLLKSPRGGGVPQEQLMLLTDEKATTAAVRNGFQDFLKRRAGNKDTVILLIAGHGTVETPGSKNAFILTYDTDPQDLVSTALPMAELRSLFDEQLKKVGRVLLFVDVCKAGTIGSIQNSTVSADVQHLGDVDGELFGLLASRPKEISVEGPQFGGGHGVFSYFVIKGLTGEADANKDGTVDADELIKYVSEHVPAATANKQHPREFGNYDNSLKLSDVNKPGIEVTYFRRIYDWRHGEPLYLASAVQDALPAKPAQDLVRFNSAIAAGRLLPTQADNAFDALKPLEAELSPERYYEVQNQLRVALENQAQEVLLRYLAGDQNSQNQKDFAMAAQYIEAARTLTRESLFLEGREDFFQGRALLFDKKFADAAALLEDSVRIDPGAAYGYNALGIAYLEEAQFEKAIPAFRDASRRAPHWSYPLHNLALSYVETGDYSSAIRVYQQAIRLGPQYSYLPYNLGLVYQRLNRRKDAEAAYRKAMTLAPDSPDPYNALGTLKAAEGKSQDAEQLYRSALQRNASLPSARHNLALLLAGQRNRQTEAIALWRTNLAQSPDYLPSRLSLAETLASAGDTAGAAQEYRKVLEQKPGYIAARLALARVLTNAGNIDQAIAELREASQADPQNPAILEQIGDAEATRGRAAEARAAFQSALGRAPDRASRKHLENKLKATK